MKKTADNLNIFRLNDVAEATQQAGEALNKILLDFLQNPTMLLLSGGSAFGLLDYIDETVLGEQLTIAMIDERFSEDKTINNFAQLQDTDFYMKALERDASFIGTLPRKEDTPQTLSARFEATLKKWHKENPTGKIVATLGMGPDGHTAGIMPFAEDPELFKKLFDAEQWVTAYEATGKNPHPLRITTTLPFLRLVNKAVGFIAGENKKPAFNQVAAKQGFIAQIPGLVFLGVKRHANLYGY